MQVCSWNSDMMDRTRVLFIFLTSTILWLLFHVSVTCTVMVKGQSDQELEAYLKRLNKPAVKTMTDKDGEVIDCVDIYKQPALDHPLLKDHIVQQAGAVKTGEGPYLGARALINVWNVPVEANEWSHSAIEISDSVKYYIEAGWIADGYGRTGCYNLLCPGFVQVSKKFAPGIIVQPLSSYNGSQFVIAITVYKDNVNLNWWLHLKGEPVGYWPGVLFGGVDMMFQEANQVKWIGSVLNKWNKGHHTTTHMGSGYLAEEGWGKAAYFRAVFIMNMLNNFVPPNGAQLIATAKGCYNVKLGSGSILFYYGGPGGLYWSRGRHAATSNRHRLTGGSRRHLAGKPPHPTPSPLVGERLWSPILLTHATLVANAAATSSLDVATSSPFSSPRCRQHYFSLLLTPPTMRNHDRLCRFLPRLQQAVVVSLVSSKLSSSPSPLAHQRS
ncbi:hypothetical protein ZIOFF_029243 [Zingiber officinale]|uniref:Neprosin PEP catalytic domain-containing protein n=1 Tax=Zingiber officinale TaxID=94328 RepID=A0A8J5GPB1_ZINOF|nr:hypothetical protein ZIOFF_029243 [Zingiber officinale]